MKKHQWNHETNVNHDRVQPHRCVYGGTLRDGVRKLLVAALGLLSLLALGQAAHGASWTVSGGWEGDETSNKFDFKNPRYGLEFVGVPAGANVTFTVTLTAPYANYISLLDENGVTELRRSGPNWQTTLTYSSTSSRRFQIVCLPYYTWYPLDFTLKVDCASYSFGLYPCFQAYQNSNYSGTCWNIKPWSAVFGNDSISSLRVPRGAVVKAYQHGIGSGNHKTFFNDVPYVGNSLNDAISSFQWDNFDMNDFFMVFTADSQLCWPNEDAWEKQNMAGWSREQKGLWYATKRSEGINKAYDSLGYARVGGVVYNGDLTEFGDQGPDLGYFKQSCMPPFLKSNVYIGLGNHDYENNVNDTGTWATFTWNNSVGGMMNYLEDQKTEIQPANYSGDSMAYSFNIGKVHFVQLHNHPSYQTSFRVGDLVTGHNHNIRTSYYNNWLANDLNANTTRDQSSRKRTVLLMHDWWAESGNRDFASTLTNYPVSAIFAGDIHSSLGVCQQMNVAGRVTPVVWGGAAQYGTFVVARFVESTKKMYVWKLKMDRSQYANAANMLKIIKADGSEVVFSTVSNPWNIGSGATYYSYITTTHF